jgi:hypothetical protein
MSTDFFNGLGIGGDEDKLILATSTAAKPSKPVKAFPCTICAGTGEVRKEYGYSMMTRRVYVNKCKACKGVGSFKTSPEFRAKSRANIAANKARKQQSGLATFESTYPGLFAFLQNAASWSQFAESLSQAVLKYGSLTDKQLQHVTADHGRVDIAAIEALFDHATANGLQRPKLTVDRLQITRAGANSVNAGALYVKDSGDYAGKIVQSVWNPVRTAASDILELLQALAIDPKSAAIAYGKQTGLCSCCGRELTNKESIDKGIGPICESKWF